MPAPQQKTVRIDFPAIPDSDIQVALRDPEKRKDYERWKAERAGQASPAE